MVRAGAGRCMCDDRGKLAPCDTLGPRGRCQPVTVRPVRRIGVSSLSTGAHVTHLATRRHALVFCVFCHIVGMVCTEDNIRYFLTSIYMFC